MSHHSDTRMRIIMIIKRINRMDRIEWLPLRDTHRSGLLFQGQASRTEVFVPLVYTPEYTSTVQRIVSTLQLSCQPSLFFFFPSFLRTLPRLVILHLFFFFFFLSASLSLSVFSFSLLFLSHPHCLHALCIYAQRCEAQPAEIYHIHTSHHSPLSLHPLLFSLSSLYQEEQSKEEFLLPVRFCICSRFYTYTSIHSFYSPPTDIPRISTYRAIVTKACPNQLPLLWLYPGQLVLSFPNNCHPQSSILPFIPY